MDAPRLIKKYANRRLYDTVESRHVTLAGLRSMIVAGTDVKVVDETTGDDITRALLLQIIVDREQAGEPLLTEVLLAQLIRFYGNPMQGMMGDYLQRSVGAFLEQQRTVQSRFRSAISNTPVDTLREVVRSNATAWESMMGLSPRDPQAAGTETDDVPGPENRLSGPRGAGDDESGDEAGADQPVSGKRS